MFNYEKRLQYPINITQKNPQAAAFIISHWLPAFDVYSMGVGMQYCPPHLSAFR